MIRDWSAFYTLLTKQKRTRDTGTQDKDDKDLNKVKLQTENTRNKQENGWRGRGIKSQEMTKESTEGSFCYSVSLFIPFISRLLSSASHWDKYSLASFLFSSLASKCNHQLKASFFVFIQIQIKHHEREREILLILFERYLYIILFDLFSSFTILQFFQSLSLLSYNYLLSHIPVSLAYQEERPQRKSQRHKHKNRRK